MESSSVLIASVFGAPCTSGLGWFRSTRWVVGVWGDALDESVVRLPNELVFETVNSSICNDKVRMIRK